MFDIEDRITRNTSGPSAKGRATTRTRVFATVTVDLFASSIGLVLALLFLVVVSKLSVNSASHFSQNLFRCLGFPLAVTLAMVFGGFYKPRNILFFYSPLRELKNLVFCISLGAIWELASQTFFYHVWNFSAPATSIILNAGLFTCAILPLAHGLEHYLFSRSRTLRVLIIGSDDHSLHLETLANLEPGVAVVGYVNSGRDGMTVEESVGAFSDLRELVEKTEANMIIVGFPRPPGDPISSLLRPLMESNVQICFVPDLRQLLSWRSRISFLSGLPLVEVAPTDASRWDFFLKRLLDVCFSILLLVLFSPVFLLIAIGIRLTSRGPVIFRQDRVGRNREIFKVLKFRTMVASNPENTTVTADKGVRNTPYENLASIRNKVDEEGKITNIGKLLRRMSLDELPQFLNVLVGHMSLVGPRPFVEEESNEITGWPAKRFEMRPGMTGLWQVSGRNLLSRVELFELDYVYASSWSLSWDIKIIMETPGVMFRGTGAF